MADEEILRRLDAHLARGNEIMARNNEIMARNNEVIDENRRAFEDLGTFLRELTLRQERATQALIGRMEELFHELIEESRMHRAALIQILERLDNGGAEAAT